MSIGESVRATVFVVNCLIPNFALRDPFELKISCANIGRPGQSSNPEPTLPQCRQARLRGCGGGDA